MIEIPHVHLYDIATFKVYEKQHVTYLEGKVTLISERGCQIKVGTEQYFAKWENIKEIKNNSEDMDRYLELINLVERKFPNESRYETALRYIKAAESKAKESNTKSASNQ